MPCEQVYVTNPDHLPASDIAIEVITATDGIIEATTRGNGMIKVTVNTVDGDNTLFIEVSLITFLTH